MEARPNTHHAREYKISSHRSYYRLLSVGRSLLYLEVATTIIFFYFNYHQLIPKPCLPLVPLSSFHHQPGSRSPPDQSLRHFEFKHLSVIGNHIFTQLETATNGWKPHRTPFASLRRKVHAQRKHDTMQQRN